ncbi:MAG: hypothetical protein J0M01_02220 [Dechloromonas sp.]|jgi:hypothetical protein|nr:hypothetical protein [Dechloromonas sp.]
MRIRLLEPITLRSEPLPAGAEIDPDDVTANQLIAAGQAEPVAVDPQKTRKSTAKE